MKATLFAVLCLCEVFIRIPEQHLFCTALSYTKYVFLNQMGNGGMKRCERVERTLSASFLCKPESQEA
jgi:hypothetical protein